MNDIEFYEKWCKYNENNLPLSFAEFCYQQGKTDGVREFAELLKRKFNEFIDYDDNGEQTFESNPDLVWIAIDEVLAEWQKGAEYERV